MGEDAAVGVALGGHDGGADLAEPYSVTPAGAMENEALGDASAVEARSLHDECRAVEMRTAESAADLEFLADGHCVASAYDAQKNDTSGGAPRHWLKIDDLSEIHS